MWNVAKKAPKSFLSAYPEYSSVVNQILWNRGLKGQEAVDVFFNPDYERDVHDPLLLKGMKKALRRISDAIDGDEHIVIYGDYDADGVCASTVLNETFLQLGARNVRVYIPHREDEGYGLNIPAIQQFAKENASLIITVDCGSTNVEEVDAANKLGIDVIITDHHQVLERVPAALALVNPHQKGDAYPFKDLAGTAVAFKLAQALIASRRIKRKQVPHEGWDKWLLDLVALATITDVMPLVGENRTLVRYGLMVLAQTRRPGLVALMSRAGVDPVFDRTSQRTNLNPYTLGFVLGPRINAAGRMEHAELAFRLLETQDEHRAAELAGRLEQKNKERQNVVRAIMAEIEDRPDINEHSAIVVGSERWPVGVLGIVAGRLAERYHKPSFLYQVQEKKLVGSARTPHAFNTVELLSACQSALSRFGGHAQAGGFAAARGKEKRLRTLLLTAVERRMKELGAEKLLPTLTIDAEIMSEHIGWELHQEIARFEPFGEGNSQPVFLMRAAALQGVRAVGGDGSHLRCMVSGGYNKEYVKAIGFGLAREGLPVRAGESADIAFTLGVDEWNGSRKLCLELLDIKVATRE
ncbi:MAG: single-stranded-DNA-specific exonuclease RecJ [Candidatus Spechtbacterales bacterium]